MKSFTISEEAKTEVNAAMDALFEACTKHNVPLVAGMVLGCEKTTSNEGIDLRLDLHTGMVLHMGRDFIPDQFLAASSFIDGELDKSLNFAGQMAHMYSKYGALMLEDDPKAACDAFAITGDRDAARRAGGSLPTN